jgi:sialate O-acetylesterase
MIQPFIPYGIAGVIWYQGESNQTAGWQYRISFPLLINDWRSQWGRGDFPFYYCQLANRGPHLPQPGNNMRSELCESQTLALSLPNTGQAVLLDIGEEKETHFRNKKEAGERLARIALAKTYGKQILYSGPMYDSMKVEADKVRIKFKFADGGLVAKPLPATYQPLWSSPETRPLVRNSPNSELEGFSICGEDKKWHWANAKIDGNDVIVWLDEIKNPIAVRYAWEANPICNLSNSSGLPACPFRTDNFPCLTEKVRY